MEKKFTFTGVVLGNHWGGGKGSYPSTEFIASSEEEGIEKAEKMLEEGSLDSGMGYESLIGALLDIKETTTIEIDGKEFYNDQYNSMFIGNLTEEEMDFLESNPYY